MSDIYSRPSRLTAPQTQPEQDAQSWYQRPADKARIKETAKARKRIATKQTSAALFDAPPTPAA